MAQDIVQQAHELRIKHRGGSFVSTYASAEIITRVAENFTEHKRIKVTSIKTINKLVHYMIAAKVVGDRKFFRELDEYSGNELGSFCEDITVEDDCGDKFKTAIERHIYRASPKVYELLHNFNGGILFRNGRVMDAGLIRYGDHCQDIYLPDFDQITIDLGTYQSYKKIKELLDKVDPQFTPEAERLVVKSMRKFVYMDNKLRITSHGGDPVDLDDADIYDYLVDVDTRYDDIDINNFRSDNIAEGNGSIRTFKTMKLDQLKDGDEVYVDGGIVYHNETQHCYMIVGEHRFIHLSQYDGLNHMSIAYKFKARGKDSIKVDLVRLNGLSCDTVTWSDWLEDHTEESLKDNFIYIANGRTIAQAIPFKDNQRHITYDNVKELLEMM